MYLFFLTVSPWYCRSSVGACDDLGLLGPRTASRQWGSLVPGSHQRSYDRKLCRPVVSDFQPTTSYIAAACERRVQLCGSWNDRLWPIPGDWAATRGLYTEPWGRWERAAWRLGWCRTRHMSRCTLSCPCWRIPEHIGRILARIWRLRRWRRWPAAGPLRGDRQSVRTACWNRRGKDLGSEELSAGDEEKECVPVTLIWWLVQVSCDRADSDEPKLERGLAQVFTLCTDVFFKLKLYEARYISRHGPERKEKNNIKKLDIRIFIKTGMNSHADTMCDPSIEIRIFLMSTYSLEPTTRLNKWVSSSVLI